MQAGILLFIKVVSTYGIGMFIRACTDEHWDIISVGPPVLLPTKP